MFIHVIVTSIVSIIDIYFSKVSHEWISLDLILVPADMCTVGEESTDVRLKMQYLYAAGILIRSQFRRGVCLHCTGGVH